MRYELTTDSGASRLILVFAGWSTDASFYAHISVAGYDTMVVWDYSELEFPIHVLDRYHTVCLFAWSLGVYAAAATLPFDRLSIAIAINGTEHPVDDTLGIPESIYNGTEQSLNERNLMKFHRRMAGESYNGIRELFAATPVNDLKKQLERIRTHSLSNKKYGKWNRVYISDNDAIFPAVNQVHAWDSHPSNPEIKHLDKPHYIDLYNVVKGVIPAFRKVGERFRRALTTYDDKAVAQKRIASHLADMMPGQKIEKALEIGPGSGLFTTLFAERFSPLELDYIDLYPLPEYKAAPTERYYIEDAEEWMGNKANEQEEAYDAIVSASAIQWFVNPKRFFRNAFRLLKPGGILAGSSFLPGNLMELSSVNPYALVYRTEKDLHNILSAEFENIEIESEKLILDFKSSRDVIRHIKDTGVGGSSEIGATVRNLLNNLPTRLTYHPIYFTARKQSCNQKL